MDKEINKYRKWMFSIPFFLIGINFILAVVTKEEIFGIVLTLNKSTAFHIVAIPLLCFIFGAVNFIEIKQRDAI